jgi:hypothetical protein
MGLYFPLGEMPGEICDPEKLGRDFVEALRVAQKTNAWNWLDSAFTDTGLLARGQHVTLEYNGETVATGIRTDAGAVPAALDFHFPKAGDFLVPYRKGFAPVDDMDIGWTSANPELVMVVVSFQYTRRAQHENPTPALNIWNGSFDNSPYQALRFQSRINLDGDRVAGTGPLGYPTLGLIRDAGTGVPTLAQAYVALRVIPAGVHFARLEVALPTADYCSAISESDQEYLPTEPDNVTIRTRHIFGLRFGRGALMSA